MVLSKNYQYWRDYGHLWLDEYEKRKHHLVFYHLQQIMIADYMYHSSPARVLEFGCGVGRHLRYISQIPGIEVYGYDQSGSMAELNLRWCSRDWFESHITVGDPVQVLPYSDGYFDIVYTAEVLIHVDPEDLLSILSELIRVSKWQILHFEPSRNFQVCQDAHNGCWNHDLIAAYFQLGVHCEVLPASYAVQEPYRVLLSDERPAYCWPPVFISLLSDIEKYIQPSLDLLTESKEQAQDLQRQVEALQAALTDERQAAQDLQRQVEALQAALTDERQAAQDLQRQVEALQAALTDERQAAHRRIEQLDFELRQMREFTDRLRSILRV